VRRAVEIILAVARALGSGGHRSPRSSQRALGFMLLQWLGPVVSHCSLDAACAERPRLTAPFSTRTLLVTSHGSRQAARRIRAAPSAHPERA
jgi:hypothetical protein